MEAAEGHAPQELAPQDTSPLRHRRRDFASHDRHFVAGGGQDAGGHADSSCTSVHPERYVGGNWQRDIP